MKEQITRTIYTIGNSTRKLADFIAILRSFDIQMLVDIRSIPGSRKFPQFNKETLKDALEEAGIHYLHQLKLGGRRKIKKDSKNNRWRNDSFKDYADYMETEAFKSFIVELEPIAVRQTTVYMCAEAVWWRCHRSMVSDYLKTNGWTVLHIMEVGKSQEHSYTEPAKIVDGKLSYSDED